MGRLRLESKRPPTDGQGANFVLWLPGSVGEDFFLEWSFWPLREPGLAMVFFAAQGRGGGDIFDPAMASRNGEYDQYRFGDIDAFHLSYFRRSNEEERRLHTVNLRRSHGFHLLAQAGDPIPSVWDSRPPYRLRLALQASRVSFSVDGLRVLTWDGEGSEEHRIHGGGRVGFRQMAPLIAEYADLVVAEPS